ncbi:MAG: glycosyltransferase [Xanthobacteraceae bacterium]|nr:glycosyltransferase [Xanthobacteraceae bacterium]
MLDLARALNASIAYGYSTAESYGSEHFPIEKLDLNLSPRLRRAGLHIPALAWIFSQQRNFAAHFDTRIFSGVCAPLAAPARSAPGRSIYYCHTPPRFLYDQRDFFTKRSSAVTQLGMALIGSTFQRAYEAAIGRMHLIVANSQNVQRRVTRYLGRDSVVIYPPCATSEYEWREQEGYYLSTARLAALKRVDHIIDAFRSIPNKKLVVASGGEQLQELRNRAAGMENVSFTGWISERELRSLIGGAIATIYVPIDEDFGMSPVESMAAGKPVIGVAEGGLLETIVDGETGVLLRKDFGVSDLAQAIENMTPKRASNMRRASEARASIFSYERFVEEMRRIVEDQTHNT